MSWASKGFMGVSWNAPITKGYRAYKERGLRGMITQLYLIGDLKFGELKGEDQFGNKYYEDLTLPFGQHRWVEYADIHNPDATQIQPEWHGWMHHMFDETPKEEAKMKQEYQAIAAESHAIYNHHIGHQNPQPVYAQTNVTQYRPRGYGVGSLMTEKDDPVPIYIQPGHALHSNVDDARDFYADGSLPPKLTAEEKAQQEAEEEAWKASVDKLLAEDGESLKKKIMAELLEDTPEDAPEDDKKLT